MANPFQQMAQRRKLVYIVLILALFTVSLVHRKVWIEPAAFDLQLREAARGEVELTSSAVRLTLTGSRGLAVTFLWAAAIKKQEKHDWNEVELLVKSITKLQPYFVTPWLFQSWNLAFNVAVECDRPIDKYYYVSRGIELLAEGERRNQGVDRFPGNPDMRGHMGVTYQLKMGNSDEKYTMRSLLELSCVDPARRDPEKFRLAGEKGGQIDLGEFKRFCEENPRLVRRLRDHLNFEKEKQIVDFLASAKDIPSRFQQREGKDQTETPLKAPRDQFPVLPRPEADWPNPESRDLSNEAIGVYLISRTWFQYSQKPLPKPFKDAAKVKFDPLTERLPQMSLIIFRSNPCRSQEFIAETLEEEGWFDEDGWSVPGWFDSRSEEVVVGTESKYHAVPAWEKAYQMYLAYATDNGLYMAESESKKRDRMTTNVDYHLDKAEAERSPEAVRARKIYFQALKALRPSPPRALELFKQATPLWLDVLLEYPNFAKNSGNQEDTYEIDLKNLRHMQRERPRYFEKAAVKAALIAPWPFVPLAGAIAPFKTADKKQQLLQWPFIPWDKMLTPGDIAKITPNRKVRGLFDLTQYYDAPHAGVLKEVLLRWTEGATLGVPMAYPLQKNLLLTRAPIGETEAPPGWRYVVEAEAVRVIRDRLQLNK